MIPYLASMSIHDSYMPHIYYSYHNSGTSCNSSPYLYRSCISYCFFIVLPMSDGRLGPVFAIHGGCFAQVKRALVEILPQDAGRWTVLVLQGPLLTHRNDGKHTKMMG